ncbi:hypothetical protein CPAR01_03718 [Colletotrichum paranaense]|uniref:Uncharacterized protein n=7 Tax=Colletotrichum acutatum species complex TaxID=2707335 RepID=A0A9P9X5U8_9PEZI|nr:uncharacterized protein CLUP02_10309 [Colletotrichum lupini]XP_060316119.1 uncharacterized protein CCOS01_06177 [Colletotrichum costaricense]XP_060352210.1 uncharacterized protein CPAR01_03718 [Colletotrichum paranaense]XP_060385560.1 uncharacterized protein CTAM01_04109 [Colletotrichum tamarilloi]XP_060398208.1 uncharacterized protein CABS01_01639 [Colletotrichum abscissum]KAI3546065.1 hypothetical protein CSPX01_04561 [Colletotrichum filicis]KAK0380288.1 hypothetical protein CLIM01_02346
MPLRSTRHTTTTAPRRSIFSRRRAPAHTTHHHTTTKTTRTTKRGSGGGLFSRRRGPVAHTAPVHHQRRKPSMGDKISGAMLKLKGTLTRRPGQKAAGTRRMHGTDGRGSHRAHRY